jgi:Tfp pilus assembly protein PilF
MTRSSKNKRSAIIIILICIAGAIARIAYFIQLRGSDLGGVMALDSLFYHDIAVRISSGAGLPAGAISFNPLYPFFMAAVFRIFGDSVDAVRVLQFVIGIVTVCLVYFAGRRLGGRESGRDPGAEVTGALAAACALLYAPLTFFEGNIIGTSLVAFLVTAAFFVALVIDQDHRGTTAARAPLLLSLLLGGILGAGALGRPNLFLLLIPALPVWLIIRHGRRRGILLAAACIIGIILLLLPPLAHNISRAGSFVPVTTHGGINFYIGNRPGASPVYDPPEGMRMDMRGLIEDARTVASMRSGRELTDAEASDYWMGEAVDGIMTDPGGWLTLLGRKLLVYWNGVEIPDVLDVSFYRESCPMLKLLFMPFAVISPFSLLGLAIFIRKGHGRSLVMIFIIASVASVLLFYINTRYRLPVVPILAVMSAVFLGRLAFDIKNRKFQGAAVLIAVLAALLIFVSAREVVEINRSANYAFLGNHYMRIGEEKKAHDAFAMAYELDPDNIGAQINYARILSMQGKRSEAEQLYRKAFSYRRDYPNLTIEYGSLLDQMGRREEAKELFRLTLAFGRKRESVTACKLLSRTAFAEGHRDEAIMWIRKALEIVPGDKDLTEILHKLERAQ